MILAQLMLVTTVVTFLLTVSLFYLYFKNNKAPEFLYGSFACLCSVFALLGHYHLYLPPQHRFIVGWSKFLYIGVFCYLYSLPLFSMSISGEHLPKSVKRGLGFITLAFICLLIFTDLIVTDTVIKTVGPARAAKGVLYPYVIIILFAVTIYFYIHIIMSWRKHMSEPTNYVPLVVGFGICIAAGIVNFLNVVTGKYILPGIADPLPSGIFIASVCFFWTLLSRYSWTFSTLAESRKEIQRLIAKSNRNYIEVVQLIAKTLDAKDHYTAGHSLRVMDYAVKIATTLKIAKPEIELLRQACLLHDIGKISVPDGILNKKAKLTATEREHILKHPVVARNILSIVSGFKEIVDIIYAHHERVDGKGYPEGKAKGSIPLLARILAVADTYDAIRSERPYRSAKSKTQALKELESVKGTQLDAFLVDVFIDIYSNVDEDENFLVSSYLESSKKASD
jgi:putative nucleotidyltransferase with HDIG domain